MTIKYRIEENNLKPGTFYARVSRGEIVDLEDMIPNVVAKTSLTGTDLRGAISALTEEIVASLVAGNAVVLDGLVTFYVTLSGSFDAPDQVVTRETAQLNVVARSNRGIKSTVASQASYSQEVAAVKAPVIRSVFDTATKGYDLYTPTAVIRLTGDNLKFDPEQADEGVFVGNDVAEVRLPLYSNVGNRRIDAIVPPATSGALTITVRARYTPGGELRQTTYRRLVTPAGP
jgi:hypothetical protein